MVLLGIPRARRVVVPHGDLRDLRHWIHEVLQHRIRRGGHACLQGDQGHLDVHLHTARRLDYLHDPGGQ